MSMVSTNALSLLSLLLLMSHWIALFIYKFYGDSSTVRRRKLSWLGHVFRHDSLPKFILQGSVDGRRGRGRPRNSWKDISRNGQASGFVWLIDWLNSMTTCSWQYHRSSSFNAHFGLSCLTSSQQLDTRQFNAPSTCSQSPTHYQRLAFSYIAFDRLRASIFCYWLKLTSCG